MNILDIKEIVQKYKSAEKDRTFPFSEWHRKDVFDKLIQPLLVALGYNPHNINYDDSRGFVEIEIRKDLKIEEYQEIDEEDEQREVRGKYKIEWKEAGRGKAKDIEAIEFLAKILEEAKNFSKARQKSIWQKIAGVKIPEFSEKARKGFLEYKSALEKAKKLDEEITKIDRAIDRLVYDLYGLTEDEIKVVEKSVWGEKFEEMYAKLPLKEGALGLPRG